MTTVTLLRMKTRHHDNIVVVDGDAEKAKAMARDWVGEQLPGSGYTPRAERDVPGKGWWCERTSDFGTRRATVQVVGFDTVGLL